MAKNKKSKSPLNEATVRRMMKLADIPELSESFFNEKQGYDAEEDESLGMRRGPERDYEESEEDRREDSYGKWGKRDKEDRGTSLEEDEHEEEELHATEDELGAEDDVADEEASELDAEAPAEGAAEITPEAAQAIVDLAASLEASGALEGAEAEVEGEAEMEAGAEEVEAGEELEDLEEQLAKLGIEVVDDRAINEAVRKRVLARLLKEKKTQQRDKTLNTLTDRIFARLRTTSKK